MMQSSPSASHPRLLKLFLRLGLVLALAPFLLLTAFNQPFFDDFRNAYWTRAHGFWGVQGWLYHTWTGRFTSTVFMTVLNPVTYGWLGGVKVAAAVLFVAQWASIARFVRALFHTGGLFLGHGFLGGGAAPGAALQRRAGSVFVSLLVLRRRGLPNPLDWLAELRRLGPASRLGAGGQAVALRRLGLRAAVAGAGGQ
jgi:hypothetical protein